MYTGLKIVQVAMFDRSQVFYTDESHILQFFTEPSDYSQVHV